MAYEKTTWVNGETPISAENLNKMEQGIVEASKSSVVDTFNVEDKTTNAPSVNAVENYIENLGLSVSNWNYATVNSDYVTGGSVQYIVIGKLAIVIISDLKIGTTTEAITTLATGLPTGGRTILMQQYSTGACKRVNITNGELKTWYDAITASGNQFYGIAIYGTT